MVKRIAAAICLAAGALLIVPLDAWTVDFNDKPADREKTREDEAFYRYYMTHVTQMMSGIKMDPRTGRPILPPNWGKAGSIPDGDPTPLDMAAVKPESQSAPEAAPCCSAAAKAKENPGGGVPGVAGAAVTNQRPMRDTVGRQSGQNPRVQAPRSPVAARSNKATLLVSPHDVAAVAAAYKALAALWAPRKQDWDAEAYVLCQSSNEAIRFVQADLGQVMGEVGPGAPPYPLQVVNDSTAAQGVDIARLPAVILQTKDGKVVVYAGENLERRWRAISGAMTK
jgi:hypothetical protein